ncbi:phage portal protein [Mycobacterium sp. KBS0706]|uniref:phage portal protein n=1 Tax=Mycobacterium sp. KBS0706 TaxID=2578109 RepID=UPI00163D9909|nr:phage portal protein [Mycobacterium sp. KBS0706]
MTPAATRTRIKGTRLYIGGEPDFDGAGQGRRLRHWRPSSSGINAILSGSLTWLRARSRDLARKDPWAGNGIETYAANLVGTGIKPMSRAKDEAFREALQELWLDWTDESDADGLTDFYGQQRLAARSVIEAGEVLIRFRPRRSTDGLSVPLQIQVIEADHLPVEKTEPLPNGNQIICGVEFDTTGQRVAYWLYQKHPGEILTGNVSMIPVRVPASEVLHIFKPLRPGQVRGYPWLSSVILKIRDMLEYGDAEVVRKKFAAMFTAFITSQEADTAGLVGAADPETGTGGVMEPGTTQFLKPGEDIKFAEPADVGGSYEQFMRVNLRAIAVGIGVTYEQLTGDLTGVNFSSIRAGLNEFQRRCEAEQEQTLAFQLCRPIWARWMDEAVLAGALAAPGYAANPRPFRRVAWVAPGWRYVNPAQEEAADQAAIRGGTKSRRQVVSERGDDVERVDREIAADNARADKLGLVLDTDARKTSAAGLTQARPGGTVLPSPDVPDGQGGSR